MRSSRVIDFLVRGNFLKSGSSSGKIEFGQNGILTNKHLVENFKKSFRVAAAENFDGNEKLFQVFQNWTNEKHAEPLSIIRGPGLEPPDSGLETSWTSLSFVLSFNGRWNFAFQDFFRTRRQFWKRLFFDPGTSLAFSETDKNGEFPGASIVAKTDDGLSDSLTLETIRLLDKSSLPDGFDPATVRVVETRSFLEAGGAAILLTSVKDRLFLKTTRLGKTFETELYSSTNSVCLPGLLISNLILTFFVLR